MNYVDKNSISEMNSIIMDLPALSNLDSKEGIHNILNIFMKEMYITKTKSLRDNINYEIDDKAVETILLNYGIDLNYTDELNPGIKRSLVFYIERLFQAKGSKETINIFAEIFENFYNRINFYNIVVDRSFTGTNYDLSYKLEPIEINDQDSLIKSFSGDIQLNHKYLMNIKQYSEYKLFPVRTNLVYIQFNSGISTMNNMKVFQEAVRSYSLTSLQDESFPIRINSDSSKSNLKIYHIEMLCMYFNLSEKIHNGTPLDKVNQQSIFVPESSNTYTDLLFEKNQIEPILEVIDQYKVADYSNREQMQYIKRTWNILKQSGTSSGNYLYSNYQELESFLETRYPHLIKDFKINLLNPNKGNIVQFYSKLYSEFSAVLSPITAGDKLIEMYTNTVFMELITGEAFSETFFKPAFNIFVKYFFPAEMDYLNATIEDMQIKDKFNACGTSTKVTSILQSFPYSLATPQRGLDRFYIYLNPEAIKYNITIQSTHKIIIPFFRNNFLVFKSRNSFRITLNSKDTISSFSIFSVKLYHENVETLRNVFSETNSSKITSKILSFFDLKTIQKSTIQSKKRTQKKTKDINNLDIMSEVKERVLNTETFNITHQKNANHNLDYLGKLDNYLIEKTFKRDYPLSWISNRTVETFTLNKRARIRFI